MAKTGQLSIEGMTVNLNVDENWFPQPYFALGYAFDTMKKKRQNGQSEAVVDELVPFKMNKRRSRK